MARVSSARRKLSLSLDGVQPPSADDYECVTPPKKHHNRDGEDSSDDFLCRGSTSPYKTPKRAINFNEDIDGDQEMEDTDDAQERLMLRSSAPPVLSDIKNSKHPIRRCKGFVSSSPLRRSISFSGNKETLNEAFSKNKERIPRPFLSVSMTELPSMSKDLLQGPTNHVQPSNCALPTIPGTHGDLNYISAQTVADVLSGVYKDVLQETYVVDCRFDYEFIGGHIRNAINLSEDACRARFFNRPITDRRVAIIFHCEFSSKRAPSCYRAMRRIDRHINMERYPHVHYPDMYLIEGGYKKFYEEYAGTEFCQGGYVLMLDKLHTEALKDHVKSSRSLKRSRSQSVDMGVVSSLSLLKGL